MTMTDAFKEFAKEICDSLSGTIVPTNEFGKLEVNVEFINSDGVADETQFDIATHRLDHVIGKCDELVDLWKEFCKENGFRQNSITRIYFAAVG